MMRRWPPLWRRGGMPSKPLSHAGPGGPTRGSRATPVPAVRWRRMGWVTTTWTWGARLPRAARACGTLPTVWWAAVIENLTPVPSWAFGRRWHASRRGGWVRRRWRPSDPCPTSCGIHCGDVCYCQLTLNRSYAEPVTPLGRQRDPA